MPTPARITCSICGRTLSEGRFVTDKTNPSTGRSEICMDCMCTGVDNRRPSTFLHILQHFDVPYIESTWAKMTNKAYQKNPSGFGPTSVIGKYLKVMHMTQFANLRFADSDKTIAESGITRPVQICEIWGPPEDSVLNDGERVIIGNPKENRLEEKLDPVERRLRQAEKAQEAKVRTKQAMIDAGEVEDKTEYKTGSKVLKDEIKKAAEDLVGDLQLQPRVQPNMVAGLDPALTQENDAIIMNSLTKEDQTYLIGKWGAYYTPSQWVKMERMYNEYADEYELNIDRAETLKKICSTSVKMDEALEMGDINSYKNLSAVYGQLRKDGKFTEAQNKAEIIRPFDTVGEIVRLCEDELGPIPEWGDPDMYPQDQLDVILNDYKEYVFHLVKNEMGLGQIIERYVEKLEKAERDKEEAMLRSLRGNISEEDLDANVARMNLAEAIKREAEQLNYSDDSQYRTKLQKSKYLALDEVMDDVT